MPAGGKTHQRRWGGLGWGVGWSVEVGVGVPWRSRLWLTEQPCLAISEVFTRAITVIIISTIPCHALSWDASAALARGSLPAAGFSFLNCWWGWRCLGIHLFGERESLLVGVTGGDAPIQIFPRMSTRKICDDTTTPIPFVFCVCTAGKLE